MSVVATLRPFLARWLIPVQVSVLSSARATWHVFKLGGCLKVQMPGLTKLSEGLLSLFCEFVICVLLLVYA